MLDEYNLPVMVVAELSMSYRYLKPFSERYFIRTSQDAYKLIKPYYEKCMELKEHAYALYLNRASQVIAIYKLSEGGINATIIDMKLLLCGALQSLADSIILCHNHPSGNLQPSVLDTSITKKIADAAQLLDMRLVDSLIITQENYYSMADNGQII